MSTAGIKRPLSEEEDSPEHLLSVQPVADSDEDINSPECLLPMQPVRDGYSSDDDSNKADKMLREQPGRDNAKMQRLELKDPVKLLDKKNNSSDMKAEWVYYFLHVTYKAMDKEVSLIDASVEECLQHMFNFVSDDFTNILVAQEIKRSCFQFKKHFKWLMDHDVLDWKSCSEEEKSDAIRYFTEEVSKIAKLNEGAENVHAAIYIKSMLKSYVKLDDFVKKDREGSGKHKFITRYIEALGNFLTSDYLRNGFTEIQFPLCIKRTDVDVQGQDRHVKIVTRPDGVFTHEQNQNAWWKVIVEIYAPCQSSFLALQQMQTPEKRRDLRSSRSHSPGTGLGRAFLSPQRSPVHSDNVDPCEIEIEKPARTRKGIIVDENYKSQVRRYIENSLPQQCLEHHCVDKMAGQHVMQLFCEAMVNMTFSEKISQKAIGMFVVNEYIYFSRLDVDNEQLKLINGDPYYNQLDLDDRFDEKFLKGKEPVVQYSNFRLDITKPNHRMALIIFLIRYVYSDEKMNFA